jgi:hypothetical protein
MEETIPKILLMEWRTSSVEMGLGLGTLRWGSLRSYVEWGRGAGHSIR